VAAVIAISGDAELDLSDLTAHVRNHLAGYKVPRRIWLTDTITRQPSGKPDYRWAKDHAASRLPDLQADGGAERR